MSTYEHTVIVERPVGVVYNQWTQFETYSDFMDDVELVQQSTETMTHWKVRVRGVPREYDAAITEQRPDEVIAWHAVNGPDQGGVVSFDPMDGDRTRVTLRMLFEPDGLVEHVGDAVGVVSSTVEHSLERFKDFIETRPAETGAWRGAVEDGVPRNGGTASGPLGADAPMGGPMNAHLPGSEDHAIAFPDDEEYT